MKNSERHSKSYSVPAGKNGKTDEISEKLTSKRGDETEFKQPEQCQNAGDKVLNANQSAGAEGDLTGAEANDKSLDCQSVLSAQYQLRTDLQTDGTLARKYKRAGTGLRNKFAPITVISLIVLVLYMISLCGLLFWAFMTSFKSFKDFRINKIGLPQKWVWNYTFVYEKYVIPVVSGTGGIVEIGMKHMLLNSLAYSLGCAFFATVTPCITAYLCARFPYKFGKVVYFVVILAMILPVVGSMPSEIMISRALGLYDKIWGLWILKANFLGMYFLVFFGTFKTFPDEYTEAAKIDGASSFIILIKILLPIIRNTFFIVMLIKFIEFWNDYQIPLIYLPSYPTIAFGMYNMSKTYDNGLATPPMRMTAAMLMLIPILIIFMIFQNKLVGNLSVGGIKG